MNKEKIIDLLNEEKWLRRKIFHRGYLVTNDDSIDGSEYPFYSDWSEFSLDGVSIRVSPEQKVTSYGNYVLIGHAYDPFSMEADEKAILKKLNDRESLLDSLDCVNQLTGVFALFCVRQGSVEMLGDPVGLYSGFYATVHDHFYISSHSNLLGDLLDLERDTFIKELSDSRWFHYFGNQLPGNITQFKEVHRVIPNHILLLSNGSVVLERFYWPHFQDITVECAVEEVSSLLHKNMELITRKWKRPAISLTGGCDSRTILACTNGYYDKYKFFSFDSQPNEKPDADAAGHICRALDLEHLYYHIPYLDEAFHDLESIRVIIAHNCGDVLPNNPNDVRKRAFLDEFHDFDVEVKSWASEVGRSRYTKRYHGKTDFGKYPHPRQCSTFYKVLMPTPKLQKETDRVFSEYLDRYFQLASENAVPWQDQFYWEWHWPSRDGISLTGEQFYSSDITVPYNNRMILELLLSVPEKDRIKDSLYVLVRKKMDPRIDEAADSISNVNHSTKRAIAERVYYELNNIARRRR